MKTICNVLVYDCILTRVQVRNQIRAFGYTSFYVTCSRFIHANGAFCVIHGHLYTKTKLTLLDS